MNNMNVSSNNFYYVFPKSENDPELDHTNNIGCHINILWEENIIHSSQIKLGQSFYVGESSDCNFFLPLEKIGSDKLAIVLSNQNFYIESPTPKNLFVGDKIEFCISDFTFQISVDYLTQSSGKDNKLDLAASFFNGASLLVHAAILGSVMFFMPNFELYNNTDISVDQQLLMAQYLASAAEKEKKVEDGQVQDTNNQSSAVEGNRAKNSEGSMGKPNLSSQGRYAVAGPKENINPQIVRQNTIQEAANFGIITALNAGLNIDPNAPTAPWGSDVSIGNDPISANGSLWAGDIGDAGGAGGLGLTGIGEGSNGNGEGIGLNRINTIGSVAGLSGFGMSRGKLGSGYKPKSIQLRGGTTNTSGKLPPEVIQRIIRQNFGKFKLCYENGLRNNPSLSGKISTRFVIDRNGTVSQANNGGSDLPDSAVVNCVVRGFQGLSFPSPESGIVTVSYSISFSPM